jgi:hypothetical protein
LYKIFFDLGSCVPCLIFTPCACCQLFSNIIAIPWDCGCKVRYFFRSGQIFLNVFLKFFLSG